MNEQELKELLETLRKGTYKLFAVIAEVLELKRDESTS